MVRLFMQNFVAVISCITGVLSLRMAGDLRYKKYTWKYDFDVSYVREGLQDKPALLLLPGFGVGAFHFDRNIPELSKHFEVFSIDLLGQGNSWPRSRPLGYTQTCFSVENWRDQIIYFIENIVKRPVHIAGNSLGGYLAVCAAHVQPELIKSIILLNSTPFWSFLPPKNSSFALPFIWDGTLPAPPSLLKFGSFYFDSLRKKDTVKGMLDLVYYKKPAVDEELVNNIIQSASNPLGQEVHRISLIYK